uniref:NmrA-like family domain-containing protein 1 n=1 Tax=Latimeria chalumnae TaxID=7897 RepID=H3A4L3_LATCH
MTSEVITIFEADGDEGGSVAAALLQEGIFKVRAAVRDLTGEPAHQLQSAGAQTVLVSASDISSLDAALKGSHRCFVVTSTNFSNQDPLQEEEIKLGYRISELCKTHKLKQVLFLGGYHIHRRYGLPARHMDAKACINDYMNEIGLPKTEIILPFYFENLLTAFKPTPVMHELYNIAIPMGETAMDGISVRQLGPIVASMLRNSQQWIGKSCFLSADRLSIEDYAAVLTKQLHPMKFKDARISGNSFVETYKRPGAQDLGNMFEFWRKGGQKTNIAMTQQLYPGVHNFSQWVSMNKQLIQRALQS